MGTELGGRGAVAPTDADRHGLIEPAGAGWTYRPHIDGLRAVAVYLVVAFHAGLARWRGGFIGVDVFFVLSGYLVTSLLVRDLTDEGRVRFGRFYSRRMRRLLPAAAVNLVVVAIIFGAIGAPVDFTSAREAIQAAALYVSNWYFIREAADYFGADITASPVAQYWSLSIEEQFYFAWPLVIFGLFKLSRWLPRGRMVAVRVAVAVGGIASVTAALSIARSDPNRAYFGTDTRAYQLLAGAFLALTPAIFGIVRRSPKVRSLLPAATIVIFIALFATAANLMDVGPITRGCIVTVLTFALIVALEASTGGLARRLLSARPLVYLGRISYGTYLWHWIIILVATEQLSMAPSSTFAVTVLLATGIAALSYELLEQPIRISTFLGEHRIAVIATGLAVSVLVAVTITPRLLDTASSGVAVAQSNPNELGGTPNDVNWQQAFLDLPGVSGTACDPGNVDACKITRGTGLKVLVAGESHAAMLVPMLTDLAKRHNLELTSAPLPYCPWTRGIKYSEAGRNCFADQESLFEELIPTVDPDIVILAHRSVDDPLSPRAVVDESRGPLDDTTTRNSAMRARITAVVRQLRGEGRKVVLIEPIPVSRPEDNPVTCLSKAEFLEECRFVSHVDPTPEEEIYRDLAAEDPGVVSLDPDRLVCPYLPICDPAVDGTVVMRDDNHLTTTFARTLLGPFTRLLLDRDILPPE